MRNEETYHYVYCITNIINGMKYIGKRTCHCKIENDCSYMGSGIAIGNAIKKYGKENFTKEIIEICETEEEAYRREREIIKSLGAVKNRNYYNIAPGGLGNQKGHVITEEVKIKCRETKLKNNTMPIGEKNGMYGKYNYGVKCIPIISIDEKGNIKGYPPKQKQKGNSIISKKH